MVERDQERRLEKKKETVEERKESRAEGGWFRGRFKRDACVSLVGGCPG